MGYSLSDLVEGLRVLVESLQVLLIVSRNLEGVADLHLEHIAVEGW